MSANTHFGKAFDNIDEIASKSLQPKPGPNAKILEIVSPEKMTSFTFFATF
jgi:hypothetical protein